MKRLLPFAFAATLLVASRADAIERQHHIGISPQIAMLTIDDKSTSSTGAGGVIHYAYGLSDQFNFMVEMSSAVVAKEQKQDYPEAPRTRPAGVDNAGFGFGYIIDVFKWVPYISLLGGVYRVAGGTVPEALFLPGLSIGGGLDYQMSRSFAVGFGVREHLMISKLQTYPSYLTGFLRFEYMWGW
jgi:hypothetical protein